MLGNARLDPKVNTNEYPLCPNFAELAKRYRTRANWHLRQANDTPSGREHAASAVFYTNMARDWDAKQAELRHIRDYGRTGVSR